MIRRNRRWLVQFLSLAFLCAQFGMVVHASTHLKGEPHGAPTQLCGECLSSAPLQNMAGGGAIVIASIAVQLDFAIDTTVTADAPRGAFAYFRSRAPPQPC
jgi:hypothetical protein